MSATIPSLFFKKAQENPERLALQFKQKGAFSGKVYWHEWAQTVRAVALGLSELGIMHSDAVGILAENSPQWTYADLGILSLRGVVVPLYPTLSTDDLTFIVRNSRMKAIFVSTPEQYEKIRMLGDAGSHLKVITFYENSTAPAVSLKNLITSGEIYAKNGMRLDEILAQGSGEDLATIIYTSGTTGVPKGVMLTHANFLENYQGASTRIQITSKDVALSFLPLSHVFERLAGYYFMMFSGAVIVYAESMQTVAEDIKLVRPTVAAAVPRFYEKVYAGIQAKLVTAGKLRRWMFASAVEFRKEKEQDEKSGGFTPLHLHIVDYFFDRLVFSKIRNAVGGRMRFFISGGAPLSRELAEFFKLCGVLILEGYGLTETSPVIAVNTEKEFRFGTVGRPLPNVKVKIAEDGEILTAGPCVMKGYFDNSDATAEALQQGWFHTGDIGEWDIDGYLKITDRKKDLIVTAGGKKIAPQKLEGLLGQDPLFSQVVTLGDKKPYVVALVVLNRVLAIDGAKKLGLPEQPYETLIQDRRFYSWVDERLQKQTECLARFEAIKSFAILPTEFSIQSGELTPTLKVKRRFVMEKYAAQIDKLYCGNKDA